MWVLESGQGERRALSCLDIGAEAFHQRLECGAFGRVREGAEPMVQTISADSAPRAVEHGEHLIEQQVMVSTFVENTLSISACSPRQECPCQDPLVMSAWRRNAPLVSALRQKTPALSRRPSGDHHRHHGAYAKDQQHHTGVPP
jgi:hypothetical protein